jgi:hypothetical protein
MYQKPSKKIKIEFFKSYDRQMHKPILTEQSRKVSGYDAIYFKGLTGGEIGTF